MKRPVCICGKAMILIHWEGYYDDIEYWKCPKDCTDLTKLKPDEKHYQPPHFGGNLTIEKK
jgi:hypothetical protein